MKSYSREEFIEYVKGLKFDELEDIATFVQSYFNYYESVPADQKEEKDAAWEKYVILAAKYCISFTEFTLAVIDYRKKLNEELSQLPETEEETQ